MNLKEQYEAALKAAREIAESAKAEDRALTGDERATIEGKLSEADDLKARIEEAAEGDALLERLKGMGGSAIKGSSTPEGGSIGEKFVASESYQAFKAAHPSGVGSGTPVRIEAKGLGGIDDLLGRKETITTGTGQVGPVREPGYRNELKPDEPLTFLDLVTTGVTDIPYGEYAQIVSETNNAAIVAEGELKPLSDVTTAKAESKAYTYADGFDVTNQTLQDDGALAAFMELSLIHI